MNPLLFALLAALTAGAGVAASPGPPGEPSPDSSEVSHNEPVADVREAALKCSGNAEIPGYGPRTYLIVVDGEVSAHPPNGDPQGIGLEAEETSMIEIRCWSPELRGFLGPYPSGPRAPSWPVVVVQSLAAFEEAAASLVELVKAQQAHLRIHKRFAVTLQELEPFGFGSQDGVEFTVAEGNWTAVTSGSRLYDRCMVGSSVSGEGLEGQLEPNCDWSEDAVSDALARWASAAKDAAASVR